MYPKALPEYAPVCRELAAGLREGDDGSHLISVHPDPSPTSSSFLHDEPWLAFNMIQTCVTYEKIVDMVRTDREREPAKPTVMAEGGYEGVEFGRTQTALEIRKQAYWSQLAGGYHTYGHQDSWTDPQRWREWIDAEGAVQMGILRKIVTAMPGWWEAVPDSSLFADGEGEGMERNVALRSPEGDWALAYLASEAPVRVRLEGIGASGSLQVAWIDPANGEETQIGRLNAKEGSFTPPDGWRDAVLRLTPA
jgi:hypothetical protein